MFSEEEMQAILEGAKDDIRASLVEEMRKGMKDTVKWELQKELQIIIQEYIKDEIVPEARAALTEDKPVILKAVIEGANEAGNLLCAAIVEDFKEKLSKSWTRSNILKAMFE